MNVSFAAARAHGVDCDYDARSHGHAKSSGSNPTDTER